MSSVQKTIDRLTKRMRGIDIPFSIEFPSGEKHAVGRGESEFQLSFRNSRSLGALRTLDKIEFVDAYFHGSIDLEGNMLKLFALRAELGGPHPLIKVWHSVRRLLSRYIFSNQRAIASSYDPKLLMSFLDPLIPAYTHGVHGHDEEPLATALVRKFEFAIVRCGLEAGKTVLDIGPRWGAFTAYALQAGVSLTGLTSSEASLSHLKSKFGGFGSRFRIMLGDILNYDTNEKFDVIVIMGTLGHFPLHTRVLNKIYYLLKPGGRVYLDESIASETHNYSLLNLNDFLDRLAKSGLEVMEVHNDRWSNHLTYRQWARNFEANKSYVQRTFGDVEYRKFRFYLWGAAYAFLARKLDCYRLILHKPKDEVIEHIGEAVLVTKDGLRRSL
jgi:cyclopropane-fatty-acyl-phospholipid synthase